MFIYLHRVTFPQTLNLNNFIKDFDSSGFESNTTNVPNGIVGVGSGGGGSSEHGSIESAIKCDDCSTTDSGSAIEEESYNVSGSGAGSAGGSIVGGVNGNTNETDLQEDDEGIDMSASTDNKSSVSNDSGPYLYELFAIMIHSGSASGGHYYAYIKEFENSEWYCFNDQSVNMVSLRSFLQSSSRIIWHFSYRHHMKILKNLLVEDARKPTIRERIVPVLMLTC